MTRSNAIRTATLIALPFLLLPLGVWIVYSAAELWPGQVASFYPWQGARWLLTVVYVGGAILGWRAGRPIWFYPWLGFAVYDTVATLMQFALEPLARLWVAVLGDGPTVILGQFLYMMVISMSPFLAAYLWFRWRPHQRLLAAFTAFPPAALTFPLILTAVTVEDVGGVPSGMMQVGMEGMPPIATLLATIFAAICAVLFWRPPPVLFRDRSNFAQVVILFGGVLLCHSLFVIILIVFSFGEQFFFDDLPLVLVSASLGWLILSAPLLLPPLLQRLIRLISVQPAIASLQQSGG